ncbi:MAG: agmatine deiminase family protein [Caulobacteraceae bacterium]
MSRCVPAEWSSHKAVFVGFPSHAELWGADLAAARIETAGFVRALCEEGGEKVRLLARGAEALGEAARLLAGCEAEIEEAAFGDIWVRDTGPIFSGPGEAHAFAFNGWGGKWRLAGDEDMAKWIAEAAGARLERHDFVLEGGALDHDGAGTCLATRQCLLNPNRNRGWSEADAEDALGEALNVKRLVWLGEGIINDHTDGHVDNLARFLAPGLACCQMAFGSDDPNFRIHGEAAQALAAAQDAEGRPLRVIRIPSPGRILDAERRTLPASHLNFFVANRAVIVPVYEEIASSLAIQALQSFIEDRVVIGLPARALLSGGGAFHCISQQQPA